MVFGEVVKEGECPGRPLTLYRGRFVIDSWSGNGTHSVTVRGSAAVRGGLEYRLVDTGIIDDVPFTSTEIVGTW